VVAAVMEDAAAYWAKVDIANTREHIVPHLRVQIDVKASPAQLFDRIRHALDQLAELHAALTASADALPDEVAGTLRQYGYDLEPWLAIPYWQNPTINRDWEIRVLGLNNFLTDVSVLLDQLEVRHLEAEMARGQVEESLRVRLDALRSQLLEAARSVGYVD